MISRREILRGAAAATVVGFSSTAGAWVSGPPRAGVHRLPSLDGEVLTDPASLSAVAVDAGYSMTKTPWAVLRPGSVDDIQAMVKFCRKHRLKVAARGQGHTTFGQSLVKGGLVIDMSTLSTVHAINSDHAVVDAGIKWTELVTQTVQHGLTPPALTGYIDLSVGGTLSVGGISATIHYGAQVDNVYEVEVVDGHGRRMTCSRHENKALFEGVLGGLGQYGIITKAKVRLIQAPEMVRVYLIDYPDGAKFFRDFRKILARSEVDDAFNYGIPNGSGGFMYQLNLAAWFSPDSPPDDAHLLRGLTVAPSAASVVDVPYLVYTLRVNSGIDMLRSIGAWDGVMHPWFDAFLPGETVEPYVRSVTSNLVHEDVGDFGFLLLFAQKRSMFKSSMLRQPAGRSEWFYLFDILTSAATPGFDAAFDQRMRKRNRTLFDKARLLGGTRYPIGTLDFRKVDWVLHYGTQFGKAAALKARHDPARILAPGVGIF